ncbi:hypothetical protein ACS0TY_002135 [Phlomoides rotata]
MGRWRQKLKLELIPNEKERMVSFKKRKEGLKKNLHQLTTLCDVDACMIIYAPDQDHPDPEICSNKHDEILRIINDYTTTKRRDPSKHKSFGLSDFFKEKAEKVEEELSVLRKKNAKSKYPTWNEQLESVRDPVALLTLSGQLETKAQIVKSRIELLKNLKMLELGNDLNQFYQGCSSIYGHGGGPLGYYYPPLLQQVAPPYADEHLPYVNLLMGNCGDVNFSNQQSSGGDYQLYMMEDYEASEY